MLIDELKKANIQALKDKDTDTRDILSVVLNKVKLAEINLRTQERELNDSDVVAILMKTLKELSEEKDGYIKVGNAERTAKIQAQYNCVERFLPKMLSEHEIADIIACLPDKSVPYVMKHFKSQYAGQCDMRTVQEVLKRIN
ncbi:MAG: GatB/YqeY domain-containing protein [Clostridia bacterium]|nr:GatB/YqeY domain-containing protein [Clostridia bacterium]